MFATSRSAGPYSRSKVMLGKITLPLVPPALGASLTATAVAWLVPPIAPTCSVPAFGTSASMTV